MLLTLSANLAPCAPKVHSSLSSRCSNSRRGVAVSRGPAAARQRSGRRLQVEAFKVGENKWWETNTAPNVVHITTPKELADKLTEAGDQLVLVDFYAKWCVACRAIYPEVVKLARKNPDILVLSVDYDENKDLCKALDVKQLPYFQMYREKGRVAAFSCGVSKLWMVKDAITKFRPLPAL